MWRPRQVTKSVVVTLQQSMSFCVNERPAASACTAMLMYKGFYTQLQGILGLRMMQETTALRLQLSGQTTAESVKHVQQRSHVMLQASTCALQ